MTVVSVFCVQHSAFCAWWACRCHGRWGQLRRAEGCGRDRRAVKGDGSTVFPVLGGPAAVTAAGTSYTGQKGREDSRKVSDGREEKVTGR